MARSSRDVRPAALPVVEEGMLALHEDGDGLASLGYLRVYTVPTIVATSAPVATGTSRTRRVFGATTWRPR